MTSLLAQAHAIFVAVQTAWPIILVILGLLSSICSSLLVSATNHPTEITWLHRIIGWDSFLEHQNVGGWKWPFQTLTSPVVGSKVAPATIPPTVIKLLLVCALLPHLTACAAISWSTPVVFAGPTVAPIEEVSSKHPAPASAAGFQLSVGLGQFDWQGHEWDLIDVGPVVLGGVVLPGSGPAGVLQLGGQIATLNGIIGLDVLSTPYTANGEGWAQGGAPGTTFGASLNVQAVVAYLTHPTGRTAVRQRLSRGGLGGGQPSQAQADVTDLPAPGTDRGAGGF